MNVTFKGTEIELEFTFNSFRYMEDFDINELAELESKPFKVSKILSQLLFGAMNSNPKVKYSSNDISELVEEIAMGGDLMENITGLVELLEASAFFRALQGANQE